MAGPVRKGGKKGKAADNRPARWRYWSSGALMARKVRNILRNSNGALTEFQAKQKWLDARDGRRVQGTPRTPKPRFKAG